MGTLLPLLILFLVAGCTGKPLPLRGELAGDLSWEGVVHLQGDVILPAGSRLTIAPGTTILFLPPIPGEDQLTEHPNFPGSELIVRGTLVAEGNPSAPITFRFVDPEASPGSWGGINLVGSPHASFRFCRFTQADSALHSQESNVSVNESLFEENRVAVRFHSSNFRIENNLFCRNGTAIRFHYGAPLIRKNDIRDNDKGFFITSSPRNYRIEENNILANRTYNVVLGEDVPEDVLMPLNYWGSLDPSVIENSFFDRHRESHLGEVLVTPYARNPIEGAGISWNP